MKYKSKPMADEPTQIGFGMKSRPLTEEEKQAILQKHADLDKRLAVYRSRLANKINN